MAQLGRWREDLTQDTGETDRLRSVKVRYEPCVDSGVRTGSECRAAPHNIQWRKEESVRRRNRSPGAVGSTATNGG